MHKRPQIPIFPRRGRAHCFENQLPSPLYSPFLATTLQGGASWFTIGFGPLVFRLSYLRSYRPNEQINEIAVFNYLHFAKQTSLFLRG